MEIVRCSQGHYYDKAMGSCPVCAAQKDLSALIPEQVNDLNWPQKPEDLSSYEVLAGVPAPEPEIPREERVTGWLVCVSGPNRGKSYCLYEGESFIGRSGEMDVCIAGDPTVSRYKHASVFYDKRGRQFFLRRGQSRNPTRLNGRELIDEMQLNNRDRIEIGRSCFVFAPFCGKEFDWQDELQFCRP